MVDENYTCSDSYSDKDFALTFCPQPKNKCGHTSEIDFSNNVNVTRDIAISEMEEGDVCTYRIKSRGGSPAIMLNNRTTSNCDEFEMKYVEYNEYNINTTETSDGTTKPFDRNKKKPRFDMPGRNATFGDAGKP